MFFFCFIAWYNQLADGQAHNLTGGRSTRPYATKFSDVAQLVRASPSYGEGRGSKPSITTKLVGVIRFS